MSIESEKNDSGLQAVVAIAGYFRIAASPASLARELALVGRKSEDTDVLRLAKAVGLKARVFDVHRKSKLCSMPKPLIVKTLSGDYNILQSIAGGDCRIVDPVKRTSILIKQEAFLDVFRSQVILVTRRMGGDGVDPEKFGLHWFAPTLWRYRQPLAHVLIASAIIQIFSLVTPIFFQIVVDKVLAHHGYSTLFLLISGLVVLGLFDVILQ